MSAHSTLPSDRSSHMDLAIAALVAAKARRSEAARSASVAQLVALGLADHDIASMEEDVEGLFEKFHR